MRYYPKINSPLMRDEVGRFLPGQWADLAFEQHQEDMWDWYQKWNGTNVGMTTDGWFGKSERSTFTTEQADCLDDWYQVSRSILEPGEYLYGELIGPGVQGNPYEWPSLGVRTFECWNGHPRPFGLSSQATLNEMLAAHRARCDWFGQHDFYIEGYVGRLATDPSVVTKIKVKDRWGEDG